MRTALALRQPELAGRLVDGVAPHTPLAEHALCAFHAQLAEAAEQQIEAAVLYAEAAERWREFENVPERAYALLGQGRCLSTNGDETAERPLLEARELLRRWASLRQSRKSTTSSGQPRLRLRSGGCRGCGGVTSSS